MLFHTLLVFKNVAEFLNGGLRAMGLGAVNGFVVWLEGYGAGLRAPSGSINAHAFMQQGWPEKRG